MLISLAAEIFTSGKYPEEVATQWLSQYDADNTAAMADLVNCVLKCSGCDVKVTEDDINDPDNSHNRLNDIQEEHKERNVPDYPLVAKAKTTHAFKVSLTKFFESLVRIMHETGVLYDDIALIENIHMWVTTMSSSFLRPFRHTATVIALACVTGLCEVAKAQAQNTADMLASLEKEKGLGKKANQGRIAQFEKKIEEGKQRRESSEGTIKDFFDTTFVHRYRDVDPKIRTDCIEALGGWILILPSIFYEGTYLRYLGWVLSDQSGSTRHEVVTQLKKITKHGEVAGIRNFIERFRPRIVEMATQDAESSCRSSAVDLLDIIREKGMLEPDDIDIIGKLIFDSDIKVRKSVVNFFAANIEDLYESKVEDLGGEDVLDEADDDNKENPSAGWIKLKALGEILLNYDNEEAEEEVSDESDENLIGDGMINAAGFESRYSLAAEVLYDKVPELQDWEMLAGYLLFDHSKEHSDGSITVAIQEAFKLEEKEDVVLLEILHAVVKITLTRQGADQHKKKKGARIRSQETEDTTARKLAVLLPRLLKKFGSSPKSSTAVLRLEHVLNLGVFQELRQDSTAYAALLHEIKSQFKSHADARVLKEASVALLHAQAFEDLEETTEDQIQSLWNDTIDDLRKRFPKSDEITVRGDTEIQLVVSLTTTVTRLNRLAGISNPIEYFEKIPKKTVKGLRASTTATIDLILELVGRGLLETPDPDIDDEEDKLVIAATQTALFYFMWKGRALKEAIDRSEAVPDIDVDEIKERMETFSSRLIATLSSRAGLDACRLQATGSLLDLHVVFHSVLTSKKGKSDSDDSHLQTLVQHIAPDVQEEITSIFASAEKHFAKRAHKTLEPPADDDDPEDIDSEPEDEDEAGLTDAERQSDALKAELQLCDLTSKLVLAICAGVIDAEGPLQGKLKSRLVRNKKKLGPNISQILAVMDQSNAKKSHKSKAQQAAAGKKKGKQSEMRKKMKSLEIVEDESDEEEEVDEEEARMQELLDEEGLVSADEGDEPAAAADEDDDEDMLGD
jgi:cohesin complex subunit SA-1/2